MEFKVNIRTKGDTIDIVNGTGDAWSAYLYATEGANSSGFGVNTDTSYFDVSAYNEDHLTNPNKVIMQTNVPMRIEAGATGGGININDDSTLTFTAYGAGVLTSDSSGNITAEAGGSGVSEETAFLYSLIF